MCVCSLQLTTFHPSTVILRSSVAMTTNSVCLRIGCVTGGCTALIGQMKTRPYVVSDQSYKNPQGFFFRNFSKRGGRLIERHALESS